MHQIVPFFKIFSGEHAPQPPYQTRDFATRCMAQIAGSDSYKSDRLWRHILSKYISTTMSQLSHNDIGVSSSYGDRYAATADYLLRLRRHKMNHEFVPIYHNRFILLNSQLNV